MISAVCSAPDGVANEGEGLLKVVHITNMSKMGGVESRLCEYLESRRDPSIQHAVLTTQLHETAAKRLGRAGVSVFVPERRRSFDPRSFKLMVGYLRRERFDVAHCRNDSGHIWGGAASMLAGVPHVIGGEHGTVWSLTGARRFLESLLYRRFETVIANSSATRRMILEKRSIAPEKVRMIHDGVDTAAYRATGSSRDARRDARRALGLAVDGPVAAAMGRLDTEKAFHVAVESVPGVLESMPDFRLIVAGDGPLRDWLRRMAAEIGVAGRVMFVGFREDPETVFAAADIFISTSIRESLGNAAIEAGAAGLPVIAPRVDGLQEVVIDGRTGVLLTPVAPARDVKVAGARPLPGKVLIGDRLSGPLELDRDALARAVVRLLSDEPERERMGRKARDWTEKTFGLARYVAELEELYRDLVGRREKEGSDD